MASDAVDDLLNEIGDPPLQSPEPAATNQVFSRKKEAPSATTSSPVEPAPPTREELLARLRSKKQAAKQGRAGKPPGKKQSFPLTPIFYCDRSTCRQIMDKDHAKFCPVCRVYCYCSKECQSIDWVKHKLMCGKNPSSEDQQRFKDYQEALAATNSIYEKTKDGDYLTVIHEKTETPACLFASIAEKSNVLNWRTYIKNPIYTTTTLDTLGQLGEKVEAAMHAHPGQKIYLISVLLDRIKDGSNSECVIRLFVADGFGATMDSGGVTGGKITVPKYVRKVKAV